MGPLKLPGDVVVCSDTSETAKSPGTPTAPVTEPHASLACASSTSGDSETAAAADPSKAAVTNQTAIFFARVPPLVPYDDLLALFSRFGTVRHLNLFRKWASAKTSKGCGTVSYAKPEEASAAMLGLNGVHSFEGFPACEGPMVVEWMDASRLTSPEEAAAQKAAKAREAKAAAAAAAGRVQPKPSRRANNTSSTASHSNSNSGALPSWQLMQQLSALAQGNALAAAAANSASCNAFLPHVSGFQGLHPGVEAFDLSGLLPQPVADACGNGSNSSALTSLGDPCSWGSVVPVHLVPMMSQTQSSAPTMSTIGPSLGPLLPSAAAALSQNYLGCELLSPGANGASQLLPSPGNNAAGSLDRLCSAASAWGALGCPTPGLESWVSGVLPSRTYSNSISFTSPVDSFVPAFGRSFVAAAAAAEQLQQQQPLMVFDDAWAAQSCEGLASAATNGAGHAQSGSYALFDSLSLLSQFNEAAAAAGAASAPVNTVHSHSNHLLLPVGGAAEDHSASAGGPADVAEFLSGRLSSVLASEGCASGGGFLSHSGAGLLGQQPVGARPGAATTGAAAAGSGSELTKVFLPLSGSSIDKLLPNIPHIAKMSGAEVQLTAGPCGLRVQLQGTGAEVEAARNLMHLLSPTGHAAAVQQL